MQSSRWLTLRCAASIALKRYPSAFFAFMFLISHACTRGIELVCALFFINHHCPNATTANKWCSLTTDGAQCDINTPFQCCWECGLAENRVYYWFLNGCCSCPCSACPSSSCFAMAPLSRSSTVVSVFTAFYLHAKGLRMVRKHGICFNEQNEKEGVQNVLLSQMKCAKLNHCTSLDRVSYTVFVMLCFIRVDHFSGESQGLPYRGTVRSRLIWPRLCWSALGWINAFKLSLCLRVVDLFMLNPDLFTIMYSLWIIF